MHKTNTTRKRLCGKRANVSVEDYFDLSHVNVFQIVWEQWIYRRSLYTLYTFTQCITRNSAWYPVIGSRLFFLNKISKRKLKTDWKFFIKNINWNWSSWVHQYWEFEWFIIFWSLLDDWCVFIQYKIWELFFYDSSKVK